jgi:hypothetical protein
LDKISVTFTEREMMIAIRAALLAMAAAIARRYELGEYEKPRLVSVQAGDSVGG